MLGKLATATGLREVAESLVDFHAEAGRRWRLEKAGSQSRKPPPNSGAGESTRRGANDGRARPAAVNREMRFMQADLTAGADWKAGLRRYGLEHGRPLKSSVEGGEKPGQGAEQDSAATAVGTLAAGCLALRSIACSSVAAARNTRSARGPSSERAILSVALDPQRFARRGMVRISSPVPARPRGTQDKRCDSPRPETGPRARSFLITRPAMARS